MALEELGISVALVAICEAEPHLRDFVVENFKPASVFSDVFERRPVQCDVYAAGPPCVRFSHLGLRRGEPVASESTLERSLDFIGQTHPKVFLLENVVGLSTIEGGAFFAAMLERLREGGVYQVHHKIVNTLNFGLPQSRRRLYVVGIRNDCVVSDFVFPSERLEVDLETFLGPRKPGDSVGRLPPLKQDNARRHVRRELARLRAGGLDL
jgi:site-specific DNA-cytosine methylase